MTRPLYFLRRALDAMARGPRVTLVATGTIFVAAFLTGLFAGALHGAQKLLAAWAGEVQISVYLDPSADLEKARAAAATAAPGRTVEVVTEGEALRRFREALGEQGGLLDGLEPGVLPHSVEVHTPGIGLAEARDLAKRLASVPGARAVDYGGAWLEQLERFLSSLRWVGIALVSAVAAGAAVLVANTLRLSVFARRDEIEIMKLVGATDMFVEAPFLLEGMMEGLLGGALASGALLAAAFVALPRLGTALALADPLERADFFSPALLGLIVVGGGALGTIASALAIGRELRQKRQ